MYNYLFRFFYMLETADSMYNESELGLINNNPIDIINNNNILTEAYLIMGNSANAIKLMDDFIKKTSEEFKTNSETLLDKGTKLISKSSVTDTNITIETEPFWEGFDLIKKIKIPKFNSPDRPLLTSKNSNGYIKRYFPKYVNNDDSGELLITTSTLTGKGNKKVIKGTSIKSIFNKAVNIINNYGKIVDQIYNENMMISDSLKIAYDKAYNLPNEEPINESILMGISLYKDDYYDLLTEGIIGSDKKVNVDKSKVIKFEATKESVNAMRLYAKICYMIQSMRMNAIEYDMKKAIKFIQDYNRLLKISNMDTASETPVTENDKKEDV